MILECLSSSLVDLQVILEFSARRRTCDSQDQERTSMIIPRTDNTETFSLQDLHREESSFINRHLRNGLLMLELKADF